VVLVDEDFDDPAHPKRRKHRKHREQSGFEFDEVDPQQLAESLRAA
jgi:hypothetical protein